MSTASQVNTAVKASTAGTASYIDAAERLCATLERIGDALVTLDTATLLDTEENLGRVVAALTTAERPEGAETLEPLVRRCRAALLRCRRLDASFQAMARVRVPLASGAAHYGPHGDMVDRMPHAPFLKVTA